MKKSDGSGRPHSAGKLFMSAVCLGSVAAASATVILAGSVMTSMREGAVKSMAARQASIADSAAKEGKDTFDVKSKISKDTDAEASSEKMSSGSDGTNQAKPPVDQSAEAQQEATTPEPDASAEQAPVSAQTPTVHTTLVEVGMTGHYVNVPDGVQTGNTVTDDQGLEYEVWVVSTGDTLSSISKATDRSVDALQRVNGIQNANLIYRGSVLLVPVATDGSY